ncbi:hypothetical protein [Tanticharoenia sakaeratensis]|uniref:Uncharacterized protein n=1 Tax=Tanticharoenia sakaeratensis NBRC 103193 TaxID=1231623 RepID=A0A0D6MKX1_9PROT|nr:hypothetical protein [Tanticharoenia sakaeratensis]GAN54126.1 hypothetical protein Tasa_017_009 [Tanticharoenia sakaeratensis NBRC 103193]GBQ19509.1 hypothetical protein AA103193_1057 [Tanticharoenia sakaeratensis NBRC 103193]
MTTVRIDPFQFPDLDIVALANDGHILRAERETAPGALPAFITAGDWELLLDRFASTHPDSVQGVVTGLEKATQRLMAHLAAAASETGQTPPTFTCPSDLFADDGTVIVALVRDRSHPVVCALVGTEDNIRTLLRAAV